MKTTPRSPDAPSCSAPESVAPCSPSRPSCSTYSPPRRRGVVASAPRLPVPWPTVSSPGLQWRMLGPFRGGRVDAVSGVPGRPNEFYFGARQRRRLEDDRRRPRVGADLRRAARRVDRRARRGAVGAGHRLRRQRRIDAARFDGLRQRHVQVDRRRARPGRTSASTTRSTSARSPSIPTNPDIVFVACIGHFYGASTERGVFRSTDGGKTLAEGAVQERERRRHRGGDRPDQSRRWSTPASGTRVARPGTSTRRPTVRAAASTSPPTAATPGSSSPRACRPRASGAPASRWRRASRSACTPYRLPAARARRAGRRLPPAPGGPPQPRHDTAPGRLLPLRRRRRDVDAHVVGHGAVGPRLVLRARRRRSADRRHRLRPQRIRLALEGRRQDLGAAARLAGRRRLSPGLDLARRSRHDDRGERPGLRHHAQRDGR